MIGGCAFVTLLTPAVIDVVPWLDLSAYARNRSPCAYLPTSRRALLGSLQLLLLHSWNESMNLMLKPPPTPDGCRHVVNTLNFRSGLSARSKNPRPWMICSLPVIGSTVPVSTLFLNRYVPSIACRKVPAVFLY